MALPKFYLSADNKQAIKDNVPSGADSVIKTIEETGVIPQQYQKKLEPVLGPISNYKDGFINELNRGLATGELSYQQLQEALPKVKELQQTQEQSTFLPQKMTDYLYQFLMGKGISSAAIDAVNVTDYYQKTGALPPEFRQRLGDQAIQQIEAELGSGAFSSFGRYLDFGNLYGQIKQQTQQKEAGAKESARQLEQTQLATEQRAKSDVLFQQALQALAQPVPTYTPELTEAKLTDIQQRVLNQGETALSQVQAGAQRRGITGSSIEQFGLATTANNIVDTLASQTLNFLLQSGQQGLQQREFLANSLFQAAQSYLGAGQGTESLVTGREMSAQDLALKQSQLAAQIQQFNQQLSESQRQFNTQQQYQQQQALENMNLLTKYYNQGGGSSTAQLAGLAGQSAGGLGALLAGIGSLGKK